MALSTREGADAPLQHATPGIGRQGDAPKTAALEPAQPVLFEDIDPVLLVRLYPDAANQAAARAQAMAAGQAARELGGKIIASQQEAMAVPVPVAIPPHADPATHNANRKP